MTVPYSMDLRERALSRKASGETHREIATALGISPSCVSKWARRRDETGSVAPGQVSGHKVRTLSGACADWLRVRMASGPFTLRGLTTELVFAKLKHLMRNAQTRTVEATRRKAGEPIHLFSPAECANYLKNSGYGSV